MPYRKSYGIMNYTHTESEKIMELLQLRYFYESAKNGSFAKTAQDHIVPASSVSASIKRLEDELGCKLFIRQSNRIQLNERGKILQRSCMAIFEELDNTVEAIKNTPEEIPEIRLLILSLRERMMSAMMNFQKLHPEIRLNTTFNEHDADPADFDIIIDKDIDKYSEYKKSELCSYQLCFRACEDSPLIGKELTMRDLRHQPFVTMESENELNSVLFESCASAGFYPNVAMHTNDQQCYKYFTQAGHGISLWRKYNTPASEKMVNLNVTDFHARQTICLYHKTPVTSPTLASFIDFIRKTEF